MKRILSVLLSLTMLLTLVPASALPVFAAEEYTQGVYTYTVTDGKATITKYNGAGGKVNIPATLDNYPVVKIAGTAFYKNAYITAVTIPDGIREIGSEAFRYCINLVSVDMSDDVIEIGGWAFCNNDNLTTMELSKSVTKLTIGVFGCCPQLKEITIPDGVTYIGEEAFFECMSLTSIVIPESVMFIDISAFDGCTSLSEIVLPDDIPQMGAQFYNTAYYNNDANWEKGALYIGSYLIGTKNDLSNCFVVKEGTRKISGGFVRCSSLQSIVIPKSVVSIESVFYGCTSLTDVYYAGSEGDRANIEMPNVDSPLLSATWHYNSGVYNGMMYETINSEVTITGHTDDLPAELVIPDTIGGYPVTAIGDTAFVLCDFLTAVTMPDSLKHIGNGAFICCSSLTSIIIPDSVTDIAGEAFINCAGLTSVVLPNSITTIPYWMFMGCSSLVSVVIPDRVTRIGESAFVDCISLASVVIPKSITSIDMVAFYNCPSLTDVYYFGTEEDRANIRVDVGNDPLLSTTWHYNYVEPAKLFSPVVTHSVMDTERGAGLAFKFELSAAVGIKGTNIVDFTNATINYMGETCKLVGMGAVMSNRADATLDLEHINGITTIDIPAVYLTDWEPDSCAFSTRIVNIPDEYIEHAIYARPYYIVEVDGEEIVVYGGIDAASCQSVSDNG